MNNGGEGGLTIGTNCIHTCTDRSVWLVKYLPKKDFRIVSLAKRGFENRAKQHRLLGAFANLHIVISQQEQKQRNDHGPKSIDGGLSRYFSPHGMRQGLLCPWCSSTDVSEGRRCALEGQCIDFCPHPNPQGLLSTGLLPSVGRDQDGVRKPWGVLDRQQNSELALRDRNAA
jgi:hypothetical protein